MSDFRKITYFCSFCHFEFLSLCVRMFFVGMVLTKHSDTFERIFIRSFFIADV